MLEAIDCPVLPGLALALDQGLDVRGILDLLTAAVAASVASDLLRAIEQSDLRFAGDPGEPTADVFVGDRVVVAVEADVGGPTDGDVDTFVGGGTIQRQRSQLRLLLENDSRFLAQFPA